MSEPLRLRPLTVVEILDSAFHLYRRNLGVFLGVFSLLYLPLAALSILVAGWATGTATTDAERKGIQSAAVALENLFLLLVAAPLARGALIRAIADRYLHVPTSIGRCYGAFGRQFLRFGVAVFLYISLFVIGTGLCALPGLLVVMWFFAVPEVCILERSGPFDSIRRSFRLARKHELRILGMWTAVSLLFLTLNCALAAAAESLLPKATENPILQALLQEGLRHLLAAFLVPFFSTAWVLLYYDIRVREEGYDLEVLAVGADKS